MARTVVPLTSNFADFNTGLNSLSANGGGDTPEAVYSGIVEALRSSWQVGGKRSVILIGDAPPHDPEPVTGLTGDMVTKMLNGVALLPEPISPSLAARTAAPESRDQVPTADTETVESDRAVIQRIQSFAAEKGPGGRLAVLDQCELGTDEFHGPYRTGDPAAHRSRSRTPARLVTRLSTPSMKSTISLWHPDLCSAARSKDCR